MVPSSSYASTKNHSCSPPLSRNQCFFFPLFSFVFSPFVPPSSSSTFHPTISPMHVDQWCSPLARSQTSQLCLQDDVPSSSSFLTFADAPFPPCPPGPTFEYLIRLPADIVSTSLFYSAPDSKLTTSKLPRTPVVSTPPFTILQKRPGYRRRFFALPTWLRGSRRQRRCLSLYSRQ